MSRGGMWFSVLVVPYLCTEKGLDPDESKMKAYDFTMLGPEKVGEQDAKVVRYRFGQGDGCPDDGEVTLWLDAKRLLPLKRTLVIKRDGPSITEFYRDFRLDPKIDAKAFELPK